MKTNSQYAAIGRLISRKKGATPAELIAVTFSSCVHKRMSEMRRRGWTIWREEIAGERHGLYRGIPPQAA